MQHINTFSDFVYPIDPSRFLVCGADEAGRGPIVGPVVAACVVLDYKNPIVGLDDSKKLSEKKRLALFDEIVTKSLAVGVGMCTPQEIDSLNILHASLEAMKSAYFDMNLPTDCNLMLVDGNKKPEKMPLLVESVVKGDSLVREIAAASIVAKTIRDREMIKLDALYPQYGFKKHKGYPTKAHFEIIESLPLLDCYRTTFGPVSRLLQKGHTLKPTNFTFDCRINL